MPSPSLKQLKEAHPKLWEKACKRFTDPKARNSAFRALLASHKAKLQERMSRARQNKLRTAAIIKFGLAVIHLMATMEAKDKDNLDEMESIFLAVLYDVVWRDCPEKYGKEHEEIIKQEVNRIADRIRQT
jgi:hypothetical protein